MKTVTSMVLAVALVSAGTAISAAEVQPSPGTGTVVPFTPSAVDHAAFAKQQRAYLDQAFETRRLLAEQQARMIEQNVATQRKLVEQMAPRPISPSDNTGIRFEQFEIPAAPDHEELATLSPEARRQAVRTYSEQVRKAAKDHRVEMRKQIAEQRDRLLQERPDPRGTVARTRPSV